MQSRMRDEEMRHDRIAGKGFSSGALRGASCIRKCESQKHGTADHCRRRPDDPWRRWEARREEILHRAQTRRQRRRDVVPSPQEMLREARDEHDHDIDTLLQESLGGEL